VEKLATFFLKARKSYTRPKRAVRVSRFETGSYLSFKAFFDAPCLRAPPKGAFKRVVPRSRDAHRRKAHVAPRLVVPVPPWGVTEELHRLALGVQLAGSDAAASDRYFDRAPVEARAAKSSHPLSGLRERVNSRSWGNCGSGNLRLAWPHVEMDAIAEAATPGETPALPELAGQGVRGGRR
jgi:hypothetical protein